MMKPTTIARKTGGMQARISISCRISALATITKLNKASVAW